MMENADIINAVKCNVGKIVNSSVLSVLIREKNKGWLHLTSPGITGIASIITKKICTALFNESLEFNNAEWNVVNATTPIVFNIQSVNLYKGSSTQLASAIGNAVITELKKDPELMICVESLASTDN